MSNEPENFTLALLRKIDANVDNLHANMATESELANGLADVRSEVRSLRADVASDLMTLEKRMGDQEKRLGDQISGLRRAVMEYHSSTIGHGVLLTELDDRLRRVERHVGLAPETEAH